METNGHDFDVQQFKYFYTRRPWCFCSRSPRMFLNLEGFYQCPECGHVVTLLAAGTRLRELSSIDQSRLVPRPQQKSLKVFKRGLWVDPDSLPEPPDVEDDVSF